MRVVRPFFVFATVAASTSLHAQTPRAAAAPCARCVVAEIRADSLGDLAATEVSLSGAQVLVVGEWRAVARDSVHRLAGRGVHLTLESARIDQTPGADLVRDLFALVLDLRGAATIPLDALAFAIKQQSTTAKAIQPELRMGIDADATTIAALMKRGIGPYVDLVIAAGRSGETEFADAAHLYWIREGARTGLDALAPPSDSRAERVVRPLAPAYVATLAALGDALPRELVPLDTSPVQCEPACVSHGFLNPSTLDILALVELASGPRQIRVVPDRPDARALIVDERGVLVEGRVSSLQNEAGTHRARALIRIPGAATADRGRFASGVRVTGRRRLTVDEIVARHQQAGARQRQVLRTLISSGRTELTFDAPGLVAPITISADSVLFAAAALLEVEQRHVRVNGLALGGSSRVPRLPLIEAERVSTPPLALTLTSAYRYRLETDQTIEGHRCYVVSFDASSGDVGGRVWISTEDFGSVRVEFTHRSTRGPIVSSEQRDDFTRGLEQGVAIWLPRRTEIHEMYEGATHRTPIHRVIELTSHVVNAPDFDDRLRAARAGPGIMLRQTADGFRYLERTTGAERAGEPREIPAHESKRVRALAFGVIVDPNITRPLPFAGLNYLDFDLFGTGTQLTAFAGAGYGRAAFTTPVLGNTRWRLLGDAFGIGARYNDRVFAEGREQYDLNLRQQPVQAMVGVVGPLGRTLRIRGEYHADYTRLGRGETTAVEFLVPPSPLVHAARVSIDGQRGPWSGGLWWSPARRQRWTAWGSPGAGADRAAAARQQDFQRYGLSLARSLVFSTRTVARVEAAWMGGRDLDRFSRYTFGAFDNRLRGYPAASIRYDRGFVGHSVVSWAAGRRLRLDGFFDLAAVREPALGRGTRTYPGVGAAVEMPMPLGLLTAVEWGYGVRGLTSSAGEGTHVVRVSAYKMF